MRLSNSISQNPFGMLMGERTFSSENYRWGFNVKEKDDEVSGSGNNLDFGARIYDGRLGRWMSVDPLQLKYPELSTYHFTNNNPILFVDYDGKDYGILVNHSNKTVMIVATIHSTKQDAIDANKAANYWCDQNGKYQIQVTNVVKKGFLGVGRKTSTEFYDVIFDINIKDYDTYEERDEANYNDKTGYGNTYSIVPDELFYASEEDEKNKEEKVRGISSADLRNGKGYSIIQVGIGNQDSRKTGSHEIGHILGIPHWAKGLMKDGEFRKNEESEITIGNVRKILSNGGLVKDKIITSNGDSPSQSLREGYKKPKIIGSNEINGRKKLIEKS